MASGMRGRPLCVGRNKRHGGSNVSHETLNSSILLYGDNVTLRIPVQKPSDKVSIIEQALKKVQEQISQMSDDNLSDRKDFIVREVVGHTVVGARTGADKKILVIQEIDNAIEQVKNLLGQEQDEKMKSFYQDLISALQDEQESVYDSLNPAQIAKLKATQNTK